MKVDIKTLSLVDLCALREFVAAKPFTSNEHAKRVIKGRLSEIEEELMDRAFGLNPYKSEKAPVQMGEKGVVVVKYEGQDPVKVIESIPKPSTHELPAQTDGNTTTDGGAKV